jgi:peptidoglycan/xylan/chitin deacetylase (PgdA/CDA1 family)
MKDAVTAALGLSGLLSVAERILGGRGGLVFNFHRVLPISELADCYNSYLAITDESFAAFLQFLNSRLKIVSLAELVARSPSSSGRVCAITFDDGWEDNLRVALPIARSHDAPMTIFLPTGLIGSDSALPEERFSRIVRDDSVASWYSLLKQRLLESGCSLPKTVTPDTLSSYLKRLPMDVKLGFLQAAEASFTPAPAKKRFLDWDQVRAMRAQGVDFGSHTVRHVTLAVESEATVAAELALSRADLGRELGGDAAFLAYPNGSYN